MINRAEMIESFEELYDLPGDTLERDTWENWMGIWAVSWRYAEETLLRTIADSHDAETIAVVCKGCNAPFYAVSRITADDVLEIVQHLRQGHSVVKMPSGITVTGCICQNKV